MKTLKFILLSVVVFIITINFSNAAPCPLGQSTVYKTFLITYNGVSCWVEAQICADCDITGSNVYLAVNDIKKPSYPGIPTAIIYQQVAAQLSENVFEICQIEPCSSPTTSKVYVKTPVCVKKSAVMEFGNLYIYIIPCDWSAYYEVYTQTCFDPILDDYITTPVGVEKFGTPSCTALAEPGDPAIDNVTDCYQQDCFQD
ncbi:MAG: hypothetical protein WC121_00515 [Candidatus Kapaibacterium sp.]